MRVEGAKELNKQLGRFPKSIRAHVAKAVVRATEQTANVARTRVPGDTGELKGWIHTLSDDGGLTGSVEAAPKTKAAQTKARSVEFGRKGSTTPNPYIRTAQAFQAKKYKGQIKRAINKAARETFNG